VSLVADAASTVTAAARRSSRDTAVRGGALVVASTAVWQVSNFGYNAAAAHILGPARYGNLTAIVALIALVNPFVVSIQSVASRLTTSLVRRGESERLRGLIRFYALRLGVAGSVACLAAAVASHTIARFLHEPSGWPVVAAALVVILAVQTHIQRGVLQGAQHFDRYSLSTVVEAVAKVGFVTIVLVAVSKSVVGAVLAVAAASTVAYAVNASLLRVLPAGPFARPISHPYRYSTVALATYLLLSISLAVDVLAAKRYLPAHTAGLYAAVSLSGKVVFFATSALSVLLFPLFAARQDAGRGSRRLLFWSFGGITAICGTVVALYAVAPSLIVEPLFGSRYAAAERFVPYAALAFGAYAIVYLAALYFLSHGDPVAMGVLVVTVAVQLAGLYVWHETIGRIVGVELAVFGTSAVALVILCVMRRPHHREVAFE
jgi:O-antigen/teichoic acid export membrane protein